MECYGILIVLLVTCNICLSQSIDQPTESSINLKKTSNKKPIPSLKPKSDLKTSDSVSSYLFSPTPSFSTGYKLPRSKWYQNRRRNNRIGSSWYGFNRYIPRSAKSTPVGLSSTLRESYTLGEGAQVYPILPTAFHRQLGLQDLNLHLNMIPELEFNNQIQIQELDLQHPLELSKPRDEYKSDKRGRGRSSYHNGNTFRRPIPIPIMIKIIPLKLTSQYIAEALKTMSLIPLPVSIISNSIGRFEDNKEDDHGHVSYRDGSFSNFADDLHFEMDRDSDLPTPSSHVATPADKPMDMSYDDEMDGLQDSYDTRYRRRV